MMDRSPPLTFVDKQAYDTAVAVMATMPDKIVWQTNEMISAFRKAFGGWEKIDAFMQETMEFIVDYFADRETAHSNILEHIQGVTTDFANWPDTSGTLPLMPAEAARVVYNLARDLYESFLELGLYRAADGQTLFYEFERFLPGTFDVVLRKRDVETMTFLYEPDENGKRPAYKLDPGP